MAFGAILDTKELIVALDRMERGFGLKVVKHVADLPERAIATYILEIS